MSAAPEETPYVAVPEGGDKDKDKERSRGREKDRDRERKKRDKRSRTRSRSRGRRDREKRRRSKERSRRGRDRTPTPEREERRRMEAEREGKRDVYTVFVSAIHPKNDERDLFEFFSEVGQVEDIRLIRDQRTSKSKGLAYIEFWEQNCVQMAIALSGQFLGGHPITISLTPQAQQAKEEETASMKLYIGNIHEDISERDLLPIFEEFGEIESLELQRERGSSKSQGYGFITFKNEIHAKQALRDLNGVVVMERPMTIRTVDGLASAGPSLVVPEQPAPGPDVGIGELDDMGGGGFKMNANSRIALMQKLQRNADQLGAGAGAGGGFSGVMAPATVQPSPCVLIRNMFDPATEKERDFHLDVQEDVKEECSNFGVVRHCVADRNSAGFVYLKFDSIISAQKCLQSLHGRYFAGRQIAAEYLSEREYSIKFPSA